MIAISFALPTESSSLVNLLRDRETDEAGIIRGKIDNKDVVIFHTGVGRKSCERKIDNYFKTPPPRILISSGFAGAARANLQVADLLLAENFSDAQLLSEAQRILAEHKPHTAKLFTASTIVDSIDERNKIAFEHGAAAVDMETEFVAQACATRAIPMLSLRVISDTPNEPFPAPPRALFDLESQRTKAAGLLFYLLTHPIAIGRLIRFGGQIRRARAKLTSAIVALIKQLPD